MSAPTTTNPTAVAVDTGIAAVMSAADAAAVAATVAALDTAAPFFATPVIKQVTDEVITLIVAEIGGNVSVGLQSIGTFIVIDKDISGEKTGVSQALANLMIAEKSGNAAQIQAAIQAYANANSALDHDDGGGIPPT